MTPRVFLAPSEAAGLDRDLPDSLLGPIVRDGIRSSFWPWWPPGSAAASVVQPSAGPGIAALGLHGGRSASFFRPCGHSVVTQVADGAGLVSTTAPDRGRNPAQKRA